MKFIKCPACCEKIDSESIRNGPKHRNPFKRRVIQCDNCGVPLKATRLAFLMAWVLVLSLPFAVVHLDVIAFSLVAGSGLVLYLLMSKGYSYELMNNAQSDSVENES